MRIPAGDNYAAPVMDGALTDPVWQGAPGIDIRYGDIVLRQSYPGQGPWRSGEYQPLVNEAVSPVVDTADCRVKWFHKGNRLYLGFDVNDQIVQYVTDQNRWDGFIVTLTDYAARSSSNHQLKSYRYSFQVGPSGNALAQVPAYERELSIGNKTTVVIKNRNGRVSVIASDDEEQKPLLQATSPGAPVEPGDVSISGGVNGTMD